MDANQPLNEETRKYLADLLTTIDQTSREIQKRTSRYRNSYMVVKPGMSSEQLNNLPGDVVELDIDFSKYKLKF